MAKNGITEEQLAQSLRQVGGFTALKEGGGARRESPFGSGYVRDRKETVAAPLEATPAVPAAATPADALQASVEPSRVPPMPVHRPERPVTKSVVSRLAVDPDEAGMEKVSVMMLPSMRDAIIVASRGLQRRRSQKEVRITANTLIRSVLQVFLEDFPLDGTEVISTEAELVRLLKSRLGRGP